MNPVPERSRAGATLSHAHSQLIAVPLRKTPSLTFPEITLPKADIVPPMVVFEGPSRTSTPWPWFEITAVPVRSVPIRSPTTRLALVPTPAIRIDRICSSAPLMTNSLIMSVTCGITCTVRPR